MSAKILAFVLAGGRGARLMPLTQDRSKPAVPFGGKYRIIDFVLSNLVNSGIQSIYVLTQFKAQSLLQHLRDAWHFGDIIREQFLIPVPAQMRKGERWYEGNADATYQNLELIEHAEPDLVAVFGADHIYKMDVRQLISFHRRNWAKGTVAALPIPVSEAHAFGTMEVDADWQILRFVEKVPDPPEIPGRPGWTLASMGNYLFDAQVLISSLRQDAADENSAHDFGGNILPRMVKDYPIFAYDFTANRVPGEDGMGGGYWRDVGTIEAYYDAHMDLRSIHPSLNLYNPEWPLRTADTNDGPVKCVFNEEGRRGHMLDSIACEGTILAGGAAVSSVLGRRVFVDGRAEIVDSVILDNSKIGAGAKLRRVILDKNSVVPPGITIGYDLDADRKRGYHVSDTGIVIVKGRPSPVRIGRV